MSAIELFHDLMSQKDMEIERIRATSTDFGFMHQETVIGFPATSMYMPFDPTRNERLREAIMKEVTAEEYRILTTTRYTSPKEQISRFVGILNKLLEKGVFDVPDMEIPVPYKMHPVAWGTVPAPVQEPTQEKEPTAAAPTEKSCSCEKYAPIIRGVEDLIKLCNELGIPTTDDSEKDNK